MAKIYVKTNAAGRVTFQSRRPGTGRTEVDEPEGRSALGLTVTGGALVIPEATSVQTSDRLEIHRAYAKWYRQVRNQGWPDIAENRADAEHALIATNRWAYHQAAYGYNIAGEANNEDSLAQLVWALTVLSPAWYRVMLGNQALRNSWRRVGLGASDIIYSDILDTAGRPVPRSSIAGAFDVISSRSIPTNFDPEDPTLIRS